MRKGKIRGKQERREEKGKFTEGNIDGFLFPAGLIAEGRKWRRHDQLCQEWRMGFDRCFFLLG